MDIPKHVFRMLVMGHIIRILVLTLVKYVEKCHFIKEHVTL
jgi:hypothetical protein